MIFKSTRSNLTIDGLKAVLTATTDNGGLLNVTDFSSIKINEEIYLSDDYFYTAEKILSLFFPEIDNLKPILYSAYSSFESKKITPLIPVNNNLYILELFRGPTSAFKDLALSLLPYLMLKAKEMLNDKSETVILTATSGDTGKACLEGFRDVKNTKVIVFYPNNGVSEIQKRQMTTQEGNNVYVCAINGNFDDCQKGVKQAFQNLKLGNNYSLSSANSINIGRLISQIVYYFNAYTQLITLNRIKVGDKINFCVPTGNFGNILAGFYAKKMGLPINKLICASNMNNVLTDFINTGLYNSNRTFYKTYSPSMDILISSNVERLLDFISDKNSVKTYMTKLNNTGNYQIREEELKQIKETFIADFCTEEKVLETINYYYRTYHYLSDPHTANALFVYNKLKDSTPTVVLSTASPYKFPKVILNALDAKIPGNEFEELSALYDLTKIDIPENLKNLKDKNIRFSKTINKEEILKYLEEVL